MRLRAMLFAAAVGASLFPGCKKENSEQAPAASGTADSAVQPAVSEESSSESAMDSAKVLQQILRLQKAVSGKDRAEMKRFTEEELMLGFGDNTWHYLLGESDTGVSSTDSSSIYDTFNSEDFDLYCDTLFFSAPVTALMPKLPVNTLKFSDGTVISSPTEKIGEDSVQLALQFNLGIPEDQLHFLNTVTLTLNRKVPESSGRNNRSWEFSVRDDSLVFTGFKYSH